MPTTNVLVASGVNTADWYTDLSTVNVLSLAATPIPATSIDISFATGRSIQLFGNFLGSDITDATGDITEIQLQDSRGSVVFITDFGDSLQNFRTAVLNAALSGDPSVIINFFANREWFFSGGGGNDSTITGNSADTLVGNGGQDTLAGGDSFDRLIGGSGAIVDDFLIDDGVADRLIGGKDNDLYFVGTGDVVVELAGDIEGTRDEMRSSIDMTIAANVEVLRLVGTAHLNAYGNGVRNILIGNTGANQLIGYAGSDDLFGGDGNDRLAGGANVDSMVGGHGNDTYEVDSILDVVSEAAVTGIDVIIATSSYRMKANTEKLWFSGTTNLDGWGRDDAINGDEISGNGGNNNLRGLAGKDKLFGNGGRDFLDGGAGGDTMEGGIGNDTYIVDNSADRVVETIANPVTGGIDEVQASISYTLAANVENLLLLGTTASGFGNALGNTIRGNSAANVLYGLDGLDTIKGMTGADWIVGGKGGDDLYAGVDKDIDTFQFLTYQDSAATTASLGLMDWIFEFKRGNDRIDLSALDANANVTGNQIYKLDTNGDFKAGEIKLVISGDHTIVLLNSDADSTSELAFMVRDLKALGASDFVL